VAGLQSTDISCTVLAYIQRACAMRYRTSIGQHRFLPCSREALVTIRLENRPTVDTMVKPYTPHAPLISVISNDLERT